jgi:hypothetical protein
MSSFNLVKCCTEGDISMWSLVLLLLLLLLLLCWSSLGVASFLFTPIDVRVGGGGGGGGGEELTG